jgi:hypothetical protein
MCPMGVQTHSFRSNSISLIRPCLTTYTNQSLGTSGRLNRRKPSSGLCKMVRAWVNFPVDSCTWEGPDILVNLSIPLVLL